MCLNFFLAKAKRYYSIQKLRNKTKTFWVSSQISKTKTERFEVSKKIWKLKKLTAFVPKILRSERERFGLIMNLVSKTNIFDFFGDVSRKTKANDLEKTLVWHYHCELLPPWTKELYLCTVAPLPSLWPPPPSPPSQTKCTVYTDSVGLWRGGGGGGCWIVLQTIFCGSFTLCFWPDTEPTTLLHHPTKMTSKDDIKGLVSLKLLRPWAHRQPSHLTFHPFPVHF